MNGEKSRFSRHILVVLVCSIAILCLQNGAFALDYPINLDDILISEETTCDMWNCETLLEINIDLLSPPQKNKLLNDWPHLELEKRIGEGIKGVNLEVIDASHYKIYGTIDGATQNYWGFNTSFLFWNSTWWNSSWNYRTPIEVNETSGNGLSEFPFNLTIDTATLISAGKMESDCIDLRFVNESDNATYPFEFANKTSEVIGCNTATTLLFVSAYPNETIFMYYDNTTQITNAENKTGVWNNDFIEIFHFDDFNATHSNGSLGHILRHNIAIVNTTNAWSGYSVTVPASASPEIGIYVNSTDKTDFTLPSMGRDFTIEAWIYSTGNGVYIVSNRADDSACGSDIWEMRQEGANHYLGFNSKVGGAWKFGYFTDAFIPLGAWTYVAVTVESINASYWLLTPYINGTAYTPLHREYPGAWCQKLDIGGWHRTENDAGKYEEAFVGQIDEVRISNVTRSADWIKRSYEYGLAELQTEEVPNSPPTAGNIIYPNLENVKLNQITISWSNWTDADADVINYSATLIRVSDSLVATTGYILYDNFTLWDTNLLGTGNFTLNISGCDFGGSGTCVDNVTSFVVINNFSVTTFDTDLDQTTDFRTNQKVIIEINSSSTWTNVKIYDPFLVERVNVSGIQITNDTFNVNWTTTYIEGVYIINGTDEYGEYAEVEILVKNYQDYEFWFFIVLALMLMAFAIYMR